MSKIFLVYFNIQSIVYKHIMGVDQGRLSMHGQLLC